VLALTLTAGCAVSWGNKNELSDPFGKSYTIADIVYIGVEPDDTFRENAANAELLLRSDAQSMTLTWTDHYKWDCTAAGSFEMTEENFDRYFDGSAFEAADNPAGWQESDMSAAKLRRENANTWCFTTSSPPDGLTDYLCLLQQKDGTLYLAMGYYPDSKQTAPHCFHTLFRLAEKAVPIYASMDDYAATCVEDLKQGTMTYYTSENGNYGSQAVEDTVADVRVTQLEFADSLGNLSPDGTVLELWYFQYEMKPTNEAGVQIDVIGGQELTDDGYLRESWTHYLTVLRYTSGEKTGYQVIGTYTGNDGLWYDGCNYSGEEKYYLHDFYIDYAGLNEPKMYIPNLLNAATDGYGRANQCEARLISGDGSYYFYAPITAWACNPGTEFWYSRYDTGSYFNAKKLEQSLDEAKVEWESTGAKAEKTDAGWRFVTHEGMSNTIVTLFDAPDGTCYEVTTHWTFDGSTEENQWGWNRDRAVEGEAVILQAMTDSFTITGKILLTQEDASAASTGFDALDAALDALGDMNVLSDTLQYHDLAEPSGPKIEEHTNTNIDYRTTMAEQFRRYSWKESRDLNLAGNYRERFTVSCGRWNFVLISNHKNALNFFDTGDGQGEATFYSYEVTDAGMETAVWDAFCKWFEKTAADSGKQAVTTTATDTLSRASITKSADSYVDNDDYLWYISGGKLCRWREGSAVETICTLPIDSLTDSPVRATLSIRGSRVALNYHIGGATMGTYVTELYNPDGEQYVKIDGYESIAFDNHGNIVKTLQFPPAQNNLSISYDSGKTWTSIGDADYFYGSVTEDGSSISYFPGALEIRDGYVYTTAVYDIDHQKTSDPLVTHSVRVNLKTGAQEILD